MSLNSARELLKCRIYHHIFPKSHVDGNGCQQLNHACLKHRHQRQLLERESFSFITESLGGLTAKCHIKLTLLEKSAQIEAFLFGLNWESGIDVRP